MQLAVVVDHRQGVGILARDHLPIGGVQIGGVLGQQRCQPLRRATTTIDERPIRRSQREVPEQLLATDLRELPQALQLLVRGHPRRHELNPPACRPTSSAAKPSTKPPTKQPKPAFTPVDLRLHHIRCPLRDYFPMAQEVRIKHLRQFYKAIVR
jgi:hypothetical protein